MLVFSTDENMVLNKSYYAARVMIDKKPFEAVEELIAEVKPEQAYNNWRNIRSFIREYDEVRVPEYLQHLDAIINEIGPEHPDYRGVICLRHLPLAKQLQFYEKGNTYVVACKQLSKRIREVCPLDRVYYDFKLPEELCSLHHARAEASQQRKTRDPKNCIRRSELRQLYSISEQLLTNIDNEYEAVRSMSGTPHVIQNAVKAFWLRVAAALRFVTGRRNAEILKTLEVRPIEGKPMLAEVTGIIKNKTSVDPRWYPIPLLTSYDVVERALTLLRRNLDCTLLSVAEVSIKKAEVFRRQVERLYGKSIKCSVNRGLYRVLAYEQRAVNKFLPPGVIQSVWGQNALVHQSANTTNQHYSRADVIEDDVEMEIDEEN